MVLITGIQLVYVWFSVSVLAWVIPSDYHPPEGIKNISQSTQEELYQVSSEQSSWFKQQIMFVPKKDDWPVVVDPNLQPWRSNSNWN